MKSNLISKSETASVLKEIARQWKFEIPRSKNLRIYQIGDIKLIEGKDLKAIKIGDDYLPFLSEIQILSKFPRVMVDMGAVKFVCKGANIMRPGIRSYSNFAKGDIVCIVEESQEKFLVVGKALVDSSEVDNMEKGEVIKNLHYISDKIWEAAKTVFK